MKYIKKFVGWYIWFIEKSFEGSDDVVSWIFDGCICLFLHAVAALIIIGVVLSIILYPNICLWYYGSFTPIKKTLRPNGIKLRNGQLKKIKNYEVY